MLTIVRAGEEQMPVIQQIAYDTWPATFRDILSPEQIRYMLHMMYHENALLQQMRSGHVFLLAEWNGTPGGFAAYELNYHHRPVSKLHKIYVLPSMQGKQVGKALLQEVARIAGEAGMQQVWLNVNRENKATGFYERFGFIKTGEEDIDIGNGYFMNDTIMHLTL